MMSSVIPSARRSHLGSAPILSKGKTATDGLSGSDGPEFQYCNPQRPAAMISTAAANISCLMGAARSGRGSSVGACLNSMCGV